MVAFADRQRKTREANRPAINFNQRDAVRDFARSAHGQNYNRMMDIQRQLPGMDRKDPLVQEFKDRRRTFNRYGKYPMGEMLGYTPQQMQDQYVDLSRDVRQTNKPVYNRMYPLTGGFMDYVQGGGLPGLFIKGGRDLLGNITGMGKDIASAVGITGAVDDTPEEQDDYVAKTFGFSPSDVHPGTSFYYDRPDDLEDFEDDPNAPIKRIQEEVYGGPRPHEGMPTFPDIYWGPEPHRGLPPLDVYEGPRPHEGIPLPLGTAPIEDVEISDLPDEPLRVQKSDWVDDITETDTFSNLPHHSKRSMFPRDNERVIPGYGTTYIDMEEPDERYEDYIERGEEPPAITPFDDSGREAGIAALYGQGPRWAETDRRYEDEYRDYTERMGDMVGGPMTYEEFARAYERIHQGKSHAGLR